MTEPLLPCEVVSGPNPTHVVIWMHGLGADGHDFVPMAHQLNLPWVKFVFPHAPTRPITINQGMKMRAWFDIKSLERLDNEDTQGMQSSRKAIRALIAAEQAQGFKPENILLGGFSQGGVMALLTGLSHEETLSDVLALSCYLPMESHFDNWRHEANQNTPIFLAHGEYDPVLPFLLGEHSLHKLENAEYSVDWHPYPMGHQVCAEEMAHLKDYLEQRAS